MCTGNLRSCLLLPQHAIPSGWHHPNAMKHPFWTSAAEANTVPGLQCVLTDRTACLTRPAGYITKTERMCVGCVHRRPHGLTAVATTCNPVRLESPQFNEAPSLAQLLRPTQFQDCSGICDTTQEVILRTTQIRSQRQPCSAGCSWNTNIQSGCHNESRALRLQFWHLPAKVCAPHGM